MLLAYLGPDSYLPLTSLVATLAGGLVFGRRSIQAWLGTFRRGSTPGSSIPAPHKPPGEPTYRRYGARSSDADGSARD